jgi:hypothetical protein
MGRPLVGAVLLSAALLASPLLTPYAQAIIGGCGGDPVVVLSDGTILDLNVRADTGASTVQQVAYTLHAPVGTHVVSVTALGLREMLSFLADNTPHTYDTVTRVDASTLGAAVTTRTTVIPLLGVPATGSATGATNENLRISLAP